ncbi:FtsW/RodA/SpoVE family cell cycle protein [Candidatus Berkelbacteria bacterium]|nr:FtsW/RodA/SpoVE family cell cycle protein [Candidatus Berkelbacteria bacterium]
MRRWFLSVDWLTLGLAVSLMIFGIAMIDSLTAGRVEHGLAINQTLFGLGGLGVAFALSVTSYRTIRILSLPLFGLGLMLLLLVLVIGTTVYGATRWIDVAGVQFQPSELMKPILVLVLAHLLATPDRTWQTYAGIGLVSLFVLGSVVRQPDLGTAAVLGLTALGLLAAARLPIRAWLVAGGTLALLVPFGLTQLTDYQRARLETLFQPTADPLGAGYNVIQSLIAIGNGGLLGQGIGQGTQGQLDFVPVVHTDFIFAGIAESVGFVGSVILITLFFGLIIRTYWIAYRIPDHFGSLLCTGIATLWLVQVVINIGMNLGVAPVTGIPLPFVSYGGTALVANCLALGLVLSVGMRLRQSEVGDFATA